MKLFIAALVFTVVQITLQSTMAKADLVEFVIKENTGTNSWNTEAEPITAKRGDVIRFHNQDSTMHRLHTNGAPCSHGPDVAPGTYWDCTVGRVYSSRTSGPLYDHYVGPSAQVWIEIDPAN